MEWNGRTEATEEGGDGLALPCLPFREAGEKEAAMRC